MRWGEDPKSPRALPAGTYTLRSYRVFKGDWWVSASAGRQRIVLRANKTHTLRLDARVRLTLTALAKGGGQQLRVSLRGHGKMGLSVYRKGRRIRLMYRVRGQYRVLGEGPLRYG